MTWTDEDKAVVDHWRHYTGVEVPEGRTGYWPWDLKTIQAARKDGFTQEELIAMLDMAAKDRWVKDRLDAKQAVPVSQVLSEKMRTRWAEQILMAESVNALPSLDSPTRTRYEEMAWQRWNAYTRDWNWEEARALIWDPTITAEEDLVEQLQDMGVEVTT